MAEVLAALMHLLAALARLGCAFLALGKHAAVKARQAKVDGTKLQSRERKTGFGKPLP